MTAGATTLRRALPSVRAVDLVVVAVLLAAIGLSGLVVARLPDAVPGRAAWGVLAGALQTLPVLWRRERPVLALGVFCVSVPPVAVAVAAVPVWTWSVLLFAVVRHRRPRTSVPVAVATCVGTLLLAGLAAALTSPDTGVLGATAGLSVFVLPVLLVAAALAATARAAAARRSARERRAEDDRLTAALSAQRERIAGELRGLVAARVERLVARTRALVPGSADVDGALAAVGAEAREALAGMRRALGLLRTEQLLHTDQGASSPSEPRPGGWWPSRSGLVLAWVVAVVLVAVALPVPLAPPGPWSSTLALLDLDPTRPLGLAAIAVQVLALAWWRRAPVAALLVATAGSAVSATQGTTNALAEWSWAILLYAAGAGVPVLVSGVAVLVATLAVAGVTLAVGLPAAVADRGPLVVVLSYAFVPAVWGLGVLHRRTAQRAARGRAVLAAQESERAVRAQRLGLARDLHDVLAHELSALVVTVHAARVDPSDEALAGIAEGGERIAAALPGLLGETLRHDDQEPSVALDAAALEGLAVGVREAGLPVTVDVDGDPPPDRPETDLFAGRIVTEALTNVLRHAGPTPTRVRVRHGDADVVVEVVDAGPRPGHTRRAEGSGLGLVGMRERAALLGGELEAGPHGEGWRVRARLPRRAAGEPASQPV